MPKSTIIEGIGASQLGIGMVSARIAEIVLRNEQAVIPIGVFNPTLARSDANRSRRPR
jgi:L-lactate dehydrogenase